MRLAKKWNNPTGTRTYFAWRSMRSRCFNPKNPSYEHYGARGISVCSEWVDDYDRFAADMGECLPGMSLDRIDNNAGYSPGNCRWATITEQLNNQRRNRVVEFGGKAQTASQWARELGLKPGTLMRRLDRMPVDRAMTRGSLITWHHGTRTGYEIHKCKCDACRASNTERHRRLRAVAAEKRLEGSE